MPQTIVAPQAADAAPAATAEELAAPPVAAAQGAPEGASEGASEGAPGEDALKELLSAWPIRAVLIGKPPAVSESVRANNPAVNLALQHSETLAKGGLGIYRAKAGDPLVLFNVTQLPPEAILEADSRGLLPRLAPPWKEVEAYYRTLLKTGDSPEVAAIHAGSEAAPTELAQVTNQAPAGPAPASPEAAAPAPAPTPAPTPAQAQAAKIPTPPASVLRRLIGLRAQGRKEPTTGPRPGAGNLMNSLLKTPV